MADNHSKERTQAEAAFAKTQDRSTDKLIGQLAVSVTDQNTARLKAARLERDAGKAGSRKP